MPVLSMFYGIVVYMYFFDDRKHRAPHVHVEYAEHAAVIALSTGEVLEGELPRNKMKLVEAWMELHADELMANWQLAVRGAPTQRISPLQ